MKFKKGRYKTFGGLEAVIVKIAALNPNQWVLKGAIEHGGVLWLHCWDLNGVSHGQNSNFDLVVS